MGSGLRRMGAGVRRARTRVARSARAWVVCAVMLDVQAECAGRVIASARSAGTYTSCDLSVSATKHKTTCVKMLVPCQAKSPVDKTSLATGFRSRVLSKKVLCEAGAACFFVGKSRFWKAFSCFLLLCIFSAT